MWPKCDRPRFSGQTGERLARVTCSRATDRRSETSAAPLLPIPPMPIRHPDGAKARDPNSHGVSAAVPRRVSDLISVLRHHCTEPAAAEQVNVKMRHFLVSVMPDIGQHPIARLGD